MSNHLEDFLVIFSQNLGLIYVIIEILKIYLFKSSGPYVMCDES